ncbi:Amino acid transporter, transmembrane [Ascosphaera apis ARSEF 7405]|uniref:Amino acid transporter, transmembrane n=1 Tax=Ascosphaera apis ARSEF 7405 TaxID=392613 RepID=A0A168CR36_9EURO|nr:Amino acid transporter, transmembrane [Ascosphaera apis ARSEF 7405]
MTDGQLNPPPAPEPQSRPLSIRGTSPAGSVPRQLTTARLASPVPFSYDNNAAAVQRDTASSATAIPVNSVNTAPEFGRVTGLPSSAGPQSSALATGLQSYKGPSFLDDASNPRGSSPAPPESINRYYAGSFDTRSHRDLTGETSGIEDPDIIKRHLVQPDEDIERGRSTNRDFDEFSSLQLQGGDVHRQIYKWTQDQEEESRRRRSFNIARPEPEDETVDANSIRVPGGFRRDFIRRVAASPAPQGHPSSSSDLEQPLQPTQPPILTNNFLEFLTLYGHFAGEELEEDDEVLEPDEYFTTGTGDHPDDEYGERQALLSDTPGKRPRKQKGRGNKPTNSATGAILLLLKSFVGTGVLFLPRAFLNGGILFSSIVLVAISIVSYWCFCLLIQTRALHEGSFGDIGGILYGKHMRRIILLSIVLSQIGFVAAYIVFVSTNLQAFVLAASSCKDYVDLKWFILLQLVVFLPLSLIRDISKLGFTALVADAFILLGLLIIYGFNFKTIIANHGAADVVPFNEVNWSLMVGTAIFTYEGVGLIIPIQESMKKPQQFKPVLALVMVIVTAVFVSMGMSGYAAFGSKTETVVILNLPQDNAFVNSVQFLYSVAILLSTPLQLFPAIRILENGLFTRSGKYNPGIKWKKNGFRFILVAFCAIVAWIGAGDLDKFVALVGSFACVPLVYVYPPLLHFKVAETGMQKMTDLILAVFGIAGCLYTTSISISSWGSGSSEPRLGFCGM